MFLDKRDFKYLKEEPKLDEGEYLFRFDYFVFKRNKNNDGSLIKLYFTSVDDLTFTEVRQTYVFSKDRQSPTPFMLDDLISFKEFREAVGADWSEKSLIDSIGRSFIGYAIKVRQSNGIDYNFVIKFRRAK